MVHVHSHTHARTHTHIHIHAVVHPDAVPNLDYPSFFTQKHTFNPPPPLPVQLFILMQCHNLDYPNFFPSLYRQLEPSVFYAKHRARFFRLLTLCLSSTALPSYV